MDQTQQITVPPPEQIRSRIDARRAEIADLKRLLRLSQTASRVSQFSADDDSRQKGRAHA